MVLVQHQYKTQQQLHRSVIHQQRQQETQPIFLLQHKVPLKPNFLLTNQPVPPPDIVPAATPTVTRITSAPASSTPVQAPASSVGFTSSQPAPEVVDFPPPTQYPNILPAWKRMANEVLHDNSTNEQKDPLLSIAGYTSILVQNTRDCPVLDRTHSLSMKY